MHRNWFRIRVLVVAEDRLFETSIGKERFRSDAVVAAVMDILSKAGPDAVHLSSVASAAHLQLADIEKTYGHPGELLYLVWDEILRREFENLVDHAKDLMKGRADKAAAEVSSVRQALAHLLVVAHRFDELREIVPFDVQRILFTHDSEEMNPADRSVLRALIGWLLGISLEPGHRYGDSLRLLEHIEWKADQWNEVDPFEPVERTPPLTLVFDTAGDLSQEVLGACTRIIAQGGSGRATLLRIARLAGFPPEVLYGMYGRQEHLIAEYMKAVFSLLFSYRRFEEYMDSPAHAAMRLGVWLEPDMQLRRRALIESVMASNFSPFLASAFIDAADGALADMRLANLNTPEDVLEMACVRFIASRQVALGLAVLQEVEIEQWDRVWSPFLGVFLSVPG